MENKTPKTTKTLVATTLPPDVLEQVQAKAAKEDRTISQTVRILVQRALVSEQQEQSQQQAA